MSNEERLREVIGQACDTIENLLAASTLPVPDAIHVEGLTGGLRSILSDLREVVPQLAETAGHPWHGYSATCEPCREEGR